MHETTTHMDEEKVDAVVVPPSARDYLRSRLAERYPDDDFDNEDALFGRLREDIDGYEGRLKQHDDSEKKLLDLFTKDPKAAAFLGDWASGGDPLVLLVKQYGDDFRAVLDDPEQQEKFAEARGEYVKRQSKERELKDLAEKNLAQTLIDLDAEVAAGGYTEDEATKAYELWSSIVNDGIVEKVTPDTWRMMLKAVTFDSAVGQAAHEAEVRARNSKIAELRNKQTVPENMPAMLGGATGGTPKSTGLTGISALDRLRNNTVPERRTSRNHMIKR